MHDVKGLTALVTGGAGGLGRAVAGELADRGARLWIVDLPETLEGANLPAGAKSLPLDLTADDAEMRLGEAVAAMPVLDVLVANAGRVPPWRRIASLDMNEWDDVFSLNVRAVALCLKVAAPRLGLSDAGAAVLMASINGYKAHPDQALYTASKHAVLGLMRAAALDLGRDGVRVNALAPGPVLTDALRARIKARAAASGSDPAEEIAALASGNALGRLATEQDVAQAAAFLAGPAAAGIAGVCLPVEAGIA